MKFESRFWETRSLLVSLACRKDAAQNKQCLSLPSSSIQPFLWMETWILGGTSIFSCWTPLNMTFGGSFSPFAFTVSATVKLCLSAPHDNTGTVLFPVNSKVLVAGTSNHIGISSILRIRLKSYPQRWQDLRKNPWNWMTLSSKSAGSRWARVVFALMEMEWRRFQFVYQPSDALNSGSVLSSFALSRSIMLLTDRPATTIKIKCQFLDQIQWT